MQEWEGETGGEPVSHVSMNVYELRSYSVARHRIALPGQKGEGVIGKVLCSRIKLHSNSWV